MSRGRHIPWFNPREMDDATVLALNTGRAGLLAELLRAIEQRSQHPGQSTHWLLTGPRGAGKSFFLRLLQASFNQKPMPQVRFVLLPEELHNVYAPHELLGEIRRMLATGENENGAIPQWRVDDKGLAWGQVLQQLLAAFSEPLLVVGIENMDEVLAQAFADDVDNSRLRHLMSNEPRIMFVATAVQGGFDENHSQRLFRQFEHRTLPRWNAEDHRTYLRLRARQQKREPSAQQLNRIDAYSRYTGGNPRAAAVLAATILDVDDLLTGADDLDAAIEKMSDYYRALIERIPVNTRKLFDALVRGGEPASQTDLAARTGARQNDISRAFAWLLDNGYVSESREVGSKTKQYRILDRLLVQFYRMRYMHPGQRSRLAVMADLLADMLSYADKAITLHQTAATWHVAQARPSDACRDLGQIACHRVAQTDVATAWHELDAALSTIQTDGIQAIRQLGAAVADACTRQSESHGFAIGVELLHGLAQRPRYPAEAVLRGLWIDMITMNVPFTLLQDLLGEWPRLWPAPEHGGIQTLQKVLQAFLADLQLAPAARAAKRKQDEPDLATTLTALEQALPIKTRHRLGLLASAEAN